jgi:hypothetical protein
VGTSPVFVGNSQANIGKTTHKNIITAITLPPIQNLLENEFKNSVPTFNHLDNTSLPFPTATQNPGKRINERAGLRSYVPGDQGDNKTSEPPLKRTRDEY